MEGASQGSILGETGDTLVCTSCGCEAGARDLVCPRCRTLLHSARLKELAASAERAESEEGWGEAARTWREALTLLPRESKQHAQVAARLRSASSKAPKEALLDQISPDSAESKVPKWVGAFGAVGLLLWKFKFVAAFVVTKAKFLLAGLSKGGTFVSMLASFGLYWSVWGWVFAAGLVGSIYIHEMGHVAALSRLGIRASAPMFIPGLGAMVRLHEYPASPSEDAEVGLAGPVWGLGAALACWGMFLLTGAGAWAAIAKLGAWINLFNLMPFWQLDGARGFHALTSRQRWMAVGVVASAMLFSGEGLLILVGALGAFQAWRGGAQKPDWRAWAAYAALIAALTWLSTIEVPMPDSPAA